MTTTSPAKHADLVISGMTCAACAARVEKVLNRVPGVTATVNLATESARVEIPQDMDAGALMAAVERAGYGAQIKAAETPSQRDQQRTARAQQEWREFALAAVLTAPFALQMAAMLTGASHEWMPPLLQCLLATPVQFWSGRRFYAGAWKALRGGAANMDVLVALGATIAFGYSVITLVSGLPLHLYFEASAMVITLVLLGKVLEGRSRGRAAEAMEALTRVQPASATLERNGASVTVPVAQVRVEDIFLVLPGDAIPVDGVVLDGASAVDEALLTGESMPVAKQPNARVHAGTINQQGLLRCRATGVGEQTALAAIIRLVDEAQASKAPVQRLVDRVSAVFVPVVVVIALITWLAWAVLGQDITSATINAVAVSIVACPCALGLATPVAMLVGSGEGARHGILIRNAAALENAGRITVLAIDKTGTLTEGRPSVTEVVVLDGDDASSVIATAAALEQASRHPLAQAIINHARALRIEVVPVSSYEALPGLGAAASLDGETVQLGSPRYAAGLGYLLPDAEVARLQQACNTVVFVVRAGKVLGLIAIADALRPGTPAGVQALQALGVKPVMLTGDNSHTAEAVARAAGINEWHANQLPADKADYLRKLRTSGVKTGMAGDGVNDAPALALADASFAIGGGADAAIHGADITLVRGDLQAVVDAIRLSRATLAKIRQNLFFCVYLQRARHTVGGGRLAESGGRGRGDGVVVGVRCG